MTLAYNPNASDETPVASSRSLAESAVHHLFESLLGRQPEAAALEAYSEFLLGGGTVAEAYADISKHAKAIQVADPLMSHPLRAFPTLMKPENISFFTHRGRFRPLGLLIETVNICNNDCVICPYSIQTRPRKAMSMETFRKVLDDWTAIGGGPVSLTPMVGEVFLDKLLLERLTLLKMAPAVTRISAITNATMIRRFDDEHLIEILGLLDTVRISVYGFDAEEHAVMTRKRDYAHANEAIARILRLAGPDKVYLGGRQLKDRSEEEVKAWLGEIASMASLEASEIKFSTTQTYANWSIFDTSKPLPFDGVWSPIQKNTVQCGLPLASMQVFSDGSVSFCGCADFNADRGLLLGNIGQQTLREMLDSPEVQKLWNWKIYGVPEFCKKCSFHIPLDAVEALPGVMSDPFSVLGG